MSSPSVLPVQVLREHITALEAAISVCLATPDGKPVHKLRTETRRAEALLLLLALVPGLPEHRNEAATLLRSLARLRRAAGEVRDLDVHRKMLEEFSESEDAEANAGTNGTGPEPAQTGKKKRSGKAKSARKADTSARERNAALLSEAAAELRKHMGRERDEAAAALQELLQHRQVKTARAAEKLLKVLTPAEDVALPAADLLRDAESVLSRDGLLQADALASLGEDDLHAVRKAAKAARYVAEALPDDQVLADAARRFEALQEAGGQWHDALELARAARRYFGKGHALTAVYREGRDRKLEAYRAVLRTALAKEEEASPKRRTRKPSKSGAKRAKPTR